MKLIVIQMSNKVRNNQYDTLSKKENKLYSTIKPLLSQDNIKLCKRIQNDSNYATYGSNTSRQSVKSITIKKASDLNSLENIRLNFIDLKENYSSITSFRNNQKIKPEFDLPQELLCYICFKLLDEPVVCYKCKTRYCRKCMTDFLTEKLKCPKCFCVISDNLVIPIDLSNEYEKTIIQCPHPGCKETFNLFNIRNHTIKCVFRNTKNEQREKVNKFISVPYEKDLYTKPYQLLFLKNINDNEIKTNTNFVYDEKEQKKRFDCKNNDDLDVKIKDFRKNLSVANDNIDNIIFDIAKTTKETNDTIKKVLKN